MLVQVPLLAEFLPASRALALVRLESEVNVLVVLLQRPIMAEAVATGSANVLLQTHVDDISVFLEVVTPLHRHGAELTLVHPVFRGRRALHR